MDWAALVLILTFAVRGWVRGFLSQLFAVMGMLAALAVAVWLSQWVGGHWLHARPAVVFLLVRVVVVLLAAVAVATLFRWIGSVAHDAVSEGPLGIVEGPGGLVIGAALGTVFVTLVMFLALQLPWPDVVPRTAAHARLAVPMMSGAARACGAVRHVPEFDWLRERFLKAEHRAVGERRVTSERHSI